ncbi:hypothetical protein Tco_1094216, partial [Tanacetum coccineum]
VDSSDDSLGKENASKQGRNDSNNIEESNLSDKGSGGIEVFDDTTAAEKNVNAAEPVSTAGDAITAASVIPDIDTARSLNVSAAGLSTSTVGDIFEDEMIITDTLVAIRSTRPRTTSVVIHDVEEEPRRATPIKRDVEIAQRLFEEDQAHFKREQRIAKEIATKQEAKDAALIKQMEDVQARMDADILLAERLQQEEREQFTIEEKSRMLVDMIAERKRFFAAQRAAEQRSKPPTKAQMRNMMCTYLKNQAGYHHNQLKGRSYDEVQKLFDKAYKQVNFFISMDSDVVKDSGKKDDSSSKQAGSRKKRVGSKLKPKSPKKLKVIKEQESAVDDAEKEELRACLDIVPGDDIAINVESLTTKYLIVDWKTHILTENMIQDVVDLYSLVKEMYEIISSKGYDRLLWGDLITLFESSEEDEVWKGQQDYKLISWRLFDSCGVYVLLMDTRVSIHMMVDMKYLLTQEMISRMLNRRLEVDHESTIAFELIRFIKAQLEERGLLGIKVWDDSIIESVKDRFYGSNVENYIDAIERNITMNFSICRKHKRSREWVVVNMVKIEALKKRNVDNKKLIFNGVKQYTNEYQAQQKKFIQLRCEAGLKCSLIRMTISGFETATNSCTKGQSERGTGGDRNQTTRSLAVKKFLKTIGHRSHLLRFSDVEAYLRGPLGLDKWASNVRIVWFSFGSFGGGSFERVSFSSSVESKNVVQLRLLWRLLQLLRPLAETPMLLTSDPSIVQLSPEYCSGIGCLYHKYLRRSKLIVTASFGWSEGLLWMSALEARFASRLPSPSVFRCVKLHNIAYVVLVCFGVNASWSNVFVDHTTILAAEDACLPALTPDESFDLPVYASVAQGGSCLFSLKDFPYVLVIDLIYFPLDVVEDALAQGADGLGLMKNEDHQLTEFKSRIMQQGAGLDELKHDVSTEESVAQKCKDAIVKNKREIIRANIKPNKASSEEVADLDPDQLPTSAFVGSSGPEDCLLILLRQDGADDSGPAERIGTPGSTDGANVEAYLRRLHVLGKSDLSGDKCRVQLDLNHPSIVQLSLEYCSGIGCLYHKYLRRSKLIMTASFGWSGGLKSAPDVCSRGLLRMSASSWRGLLGLSLESRVVDCHYLFLISRRRYTSSTARRKEEKGILTPEESKILEYMPMAISPAGRFIIIKLGSGRRGLKSKGIS